MTKVSGESCATPRTNCQNTHSRPRPAIMPANVSRFIGAATKWNVDDGVKVGRVALERLETPSGGYDSLRKFWARFYAFSRATLARYHRFYPFVLQSTSRHAKSKTDLSSPSVKMLPFGHAKRRSVRTETIKEVSFLSCYNEFSPIFHITREFYPKGGGGKFALIAEKTSKAGQGRTMVHYSSKLRPISRIAPVKISPMARRRPLSNIPITGEGKEPRVTLPRVDRIVEARIQCRPAI